MAQSQFVPKSQLFDQLGEIIRQGETGFLTILTDTNRSVLLRFSQGRLTRLHCRSKEPGEAIHVLAECLMLKYSYASAPVDNEPELMPAKSFLQLINPGGDMTDMTDMTDSRPVVTSSGMFVSDPVKIRMLELATEYVGIIAEMIVDEAFEDNTNVNTAIDYIASTIPDETQSEAFRAAARQQFAVIDY
jgi:hypothetical protein